MPADGVGSQTVRRAGLLAPAGLTAARPESLVSEYVTGLSQLRM